MRTIYHTFIVFLLLVSPLSDCLGQWSQINQDWCPQGEFSGPYLFFHSNHRTQPFVRLDLRDTTFQTELVMTKVNGDTFSGTDVNRGDQFAVIGQHLIYTAESVIYVSHDYGTTWDTSSLPATHDSYSCFGLNGVFGIVAGSSLYYSLDSGYTFLTSKPFGDTTLTHYPLYVQDSVLFYQSLIDGKKFAFKRVRLDGTDRRLILLDESQFAYQSKMAVIGDHLILNLDHKVYFSDTGGDFWYLRNQDEYYGLRSYNNYILGIRRIANVEAYFLSSDTFKTVQSIGPMSISQHGAVNTGFFNGDFYTVGIFGIYRLRNPDFEMRQVRGHVYFDQNQNGVMDSNELGIENQIVRFTKANWWTTTDSNGSYKIDLFYGADTVAVIPGDPNITVSPAFHVSYTGIDTVNFGYQCDTSKANASIFLSGRSTFNVFRGSDCPILCTNHNGTEIHSIVRLKFPETVTPSSATPQADRSTDTTLEWDIILQPFQQLRILTHLATKSNLNSGDTIFPLVEFIALNDWDTTDNRSEMMQPVTSSYDPNDKSVSPVFIPWEQAGQKIKLKYTIRFQNTGTDTAFDVHIADTLSPLINPESLQILETSHRMNIKAEGNAIRFVFDDIYLPDSITDAKASQGYLTFTCETRMPLGVDEKVENTAFIYFDGNEPIVTNTTTSVVLDKVGSVVSADMEYPVVYPNPTNGVLHLPNNTQSYEILDFNGKVLRTEVLENHTIVMDDLINGIYILRVQTEDGISIHRILLTR